MAREKLIITAALTGGEFISRAQTPYVPATIDEVVEECVKCRKAGASVVHLHAKDPETGGSARDPNPVLKEYVKRIRESEASDLIINITTGGGRVDPEKMDEIMKERMTFKQDLSSLNMGSLNLWEDMGLPVLRNVIFGNPVSTIVKWASWMYENNVKPELEIYDTGQINTAKRLVAEGSLKEPLHIQFVMFGGLSCMSPDLKTLIYCVDQIPKNWTWSVCAPGRYEMEMATGAILLGGHVRVGMEDNIYLEKGVLAKSNAELVAKVVRIAKELQRPVATPDEAREILGLKKPT
ncbi:MAG: 3-keto-5-aminohexanoate cleavage protein [Candidatus Freyarchaeota archaeon]|nr:3-keto-5-aminohexanoate cleavage protein [Candidatus Jordarchaeia archaeon]MBS7267311.1 3-keto-5-aminohexanoate cleavage protein [Candidatus Jordarchaeia archaeon]MBS7278257.1 3-keto-5-aminohexanoate cleavage protein [Candidatus Jordarchaeia archaeon]